MTDEIKKELRSLYAELAVYMFGGKNAEITIARHNAVGGVGPKPLAIALEAVDECEVKVSALRKQIADVRERAERDRIAIADEQTFADLQSAVSKEPNA